MNTTKGVKGFVKVPLEKRFWSKVNKNAPNGCWEWTGSNTHGYGQIWVNGRLHRANRVSYEIHFGEIPDGLFVCHKCDNPACINPDHLFLGTNSDNMKDCSLKGRIGFQKYPWIIHLKKKHTSKGEKHSQAKLKEDQVVQMRRLFNDGMSIKNIAAIYKINPSHVGKIIRFKYWTHLKDKALEAIDKIAEVGE
jgi:hypothetical protein